MNEDLVALERFVVDNDDLLKLETRIGAFNLFDALGSVRTEIRHSNCLAFLLDPAEAHGQGPLFARALLMDLLKKAPPELRPLSPIHVDGSDLGGIEVRREWQHVDLLIACDAPPFVVAIENKVDSSEHSDQLERYTSVVNAQYPERRALYVFLTVDGDVPSHGSWVSYTYADVHRVFSRVRTTHANAIGDDVLVFLDHYLNLIENQFMSNPEIDALCRRIYKNHRRALDLIYERAGSPVSEVMSAIQEVVEADSRWHVFYKASNYLDFVPKGWLDWLPRIGLDYEADPRSWFILRFEVLEIRLSFYMELRRIADLEFRKRIAETLLHEAAKLGFKRKLQKAVGDSYTRISGREEMLRWPDEGAPDPDKLATAVRAKLDEIYPKVDALTTILRKATSSHERSAG